MYVFIVRLMLLMLDISLTYHHFPVLVTIRNSMDWASGNH